MWLTITFNDEDLLTWSQNPKNIKVQIIESVIAPINVVEGTFRVSPIFGLTDQNSFKDLNDMTIHFFNFSNAYRILGKIDKAGSDNLKDSIYFSLGLSSVIMISNDSSLLDEFRDVVKVEEAAYERWIIKNHLISEINYNVNGKGSNVISNVPFDFVNYESLILTDRSIIDEFYITIQLLLPKIVDHMPSEENKIRRLIDEVNGFVSDLLFLTNPEGTVPPSLNEYTLEDLRDSKLNQIIRNQNLDRIIQINSSLSYISTQAFSGAIPILERRSLIRRYSLLGVGSGILALNNIASLLKQHFLRFRLMILY